MSGHPDVERLQSFDALAGAERDSLLRHVAGCRACRSVLLAAEPERIFSLLAVAPVAGEALDRLSARVREAVEREGYPTAARRWVGPAAVAASILLAAILGAWMMGRDVGGPADRSAAVPPLGAPGTVVGGIEVLDSRGQAQVLDLSVGETQVVMIFDRELDI